MTTWKLLDELGGHSVAVIHKGAGIEPWDVVVDLGDQSFPAQLPATVLAEVLPPEPTELGWYLATIGEDQSPVERQTDGWWLPSSRLFTSSWEQLHEDFPAITMIRLVPEPASAKLPWSHTDKFGDCAMVDGRADSDGNVLLKIETALGCESIVVVPVQQLLAVAWAAAAKLPTDTPVVGA